MLNVKTYLLQIGHLIFQVDTNVSIIKNYLYSHYEHCLLTEKKDIFVDYNISIKYSNWYRRFFKPQVKLFFNHQTQFNPLPASQTHALLEWGMNWIITTQAHQHLTIHAASLEKEGKGIIITAPSGSGKSTLCAYLVSQGWRLLSDEYALIDLNNIKMLGLARSINLKNQSIELIKSFFDSTQFSDSAVNTEKGTISLVKPPLFCTEQVSKQVTPKLIVFIQYNPEESLYIEQIDKPTALTEVIKNSFNFGLLNIKGFQCAKNLIEKCNAIYVEYSDLQACEKALNQYLKNEEREAYCEKVS